MAQHRSLNIGQLADLRCNPGAPLALLGRRVAGVPHEVVGDEHPASLKRVRLVIRFVTGAQEFFEFFLEPLRRRMILSKAFFCSL